MSRFAFLVTFRLAFLTALIWVTSCNPSVAHAQQMIFPGGLAGIRTSDLSNAKLFGALGNGNATTCAGNDDTAALQNTINAAINSFAPGTGGWVFLPPGGYKITASLLLPHTAVGIRITGTGVQSVIINCAGANTPSLLIDGAQYWRIENLSIVGNAAFPNDAIKTQANVQRAAFGELYQVLLQPNGLGIHLTDVNTVKMDYVQYWPSGGPSLGATISANANKTAILADGANAVNAISISHLNAPTAVTIANGGTTIIWNTTTLSLNISVSHSELEAGIGGGAAVNRAASFKNVRGLFWYDNFTENTDLTVLQSRRVVIQAAWSAADGTLTLGDGTAPNANLGVTIIESEFQSMTADANNSEIGAIDSAFSVAPGYNNLAVNQFNFNVRTTGNVFVPNSVGGSLAGGVAVGSTLTLQGTSNVAPTNAYLSLQPNGEKVVIGAPTTTRQFELFGATDAIVRIRRSANTQSGAIEYATTATADWLIGQRNTTDSDYHVFSDGTSADELAAFRAGGITVGAPTGGGKGTGTFNVAASVYQNGTLIQGTATPTISSGFGTGPSVTSSNGSSSFRVNVGTGGVATSGVVAMNTTAATGWNCAVQDMTTANPNTRQTASTTTTVTITTTAAWTASDILVADCKGF
jgi:hypothetical protein